MLTTLIIGMLIGSISSILIGMGYATYHIQQYKETLDKIEEKHKESMEKCDQSINQIKQHNWSTGENENIVNLKSNEDIENAVISLAADQIKDSAISYDKVFRIQKVLLDAETEDRNNIKAKVEKIEDKEDEDNN